MKRMICVAALVLALCRIALPASAVELDVAGKSAVLMDVATGTILYESNSHERLAPASVTKVMTMLLIMEAVDSGKIALTDMVTASEAAAAKGGSQIYLKAGETMSVSDMLKSIAVSSANDCACAMAEHIAGSESAFVAMMNRRAQELGMNDTSFVNCTGLDDGADAVNHRTSAYDIALMSRQLLKYHPLIKNYTTIWMDTVRDGTFGLSNTNRLLKMPVNFQVTGLKTGSTSIAKYCLSATAKKDGVELIAAIMAAPDYKVRFQDAVALLNYGYGNCRLYRDEAPPELPKIQVLGGVRDFVKAGYREGFSFLGLHGEDFSAIEKELQLEGPVEAPVGEGDVFGYLVYTLDGEELGRVAVTAEESVERAGFPDCLKKVWGLFFTPTPAC